MSVGMRMGIGMGMGMRMRMGMAMGMGIDMGIDMGMDMGMGMRMGMGMGMGRCVLSLRRWRSVMMARQPVVSHPSTAKTRDVAVKISGVTVKVADVALGV